MASKALKAFLISRGASDTGRSPFVSFAPRSFFSPATGVEGLAGNVAFCDEGRALFLFLGAVMAFDPSELISSSRIIPGIEAALKAAYDQGVQDALDRIMAAAKQPIEEAASATPAPTPAPTPAATVKNQEEVVERAGPSAYNPRAPRGLVPQVLELIMGDRPGLSIAEYETLATDLDGRLARKSVGNELRRGEGSKYERRGYRWFLQQDAKTNEAADTPAKDASTASSAPSNERTDNAAPLV
ncbi:hypothetical protein IAG41_16160 [Sphingomonas sp. JC676]|uniref:hypothetical protein n=1 Tax=Sphingomonas sp. JC676 TaxID=2768065 RepID=UPI001658416F|nr:hypothetical protein [Sphingomonas sp. JC676]MBC9033925.1 hypothetical protein [Sphingomonas sp. JC676]